MCPNSSDILNIVVSFFFDTAPVIQANGSCHPAIPACEGRAFDDDVTVNDFCDMPPPTTPTTVATKTSTTYTTGLATVVYEIDSNAATCKGQCSTSMVMIIAFSFAQYFSSQLYK